MGECFGLCEAIEPVISFLDGKGETGLKTKGLIVAYLTFGEELARGKVEVDERDLLRYGKGFDACNIADLINAAFKEGLGLFDKIRGRDDNYGLQLDILLEVLEKKLSKKREFEKDPCAWEGVVEREITLIEDYVQLWWKNLSEEEKREIVKVLSEDLKASGIDVGKLLGGGQLTLFTLRQILGFKFHIFLGKVANLLAKAVLGKGLSVGANAVLQKVAARLFGGPLGTVLVVASVVDIVSDLINPREWDRLIPAYFLIALSRFEMVSETYCRFKNGGREILLKELSKAAPERVRSLKETEKWFEFYKNLLPPDGCKDKVESPKGVSEEEKTFPGRRLEIGINTLLGTNFALFLGFSALNHFYPSPWFELLQAGFEAALVGGLADSYAVYGLFRKLGPHTDLLRRKREALIEKVVAFVDEVVLDTEFLKEELSKANLVENMLKPLEREEVRNKLRSELAIFIRSKVSAMGDFLGKLAERIAGVVADALLEKIATDGELKRALAVQAEGALISALEENREDLLKLVERKLRSIPEEEFIGAVKRASWEELQYIRLNGTLLGFLLGITLKGIAMLF